MKRRILSLIMVLVMTVGFLPAPASAATYLDTRGNWAEEAIDRWSGYGVIQGNNGKFNPGNNLTRAHMAAILSRLLKLPEAVSVGFKDVKSGAWYEDAINRCAAAGIMLGDDGYANPGASITRQQAVVMLARALKIAPIANPDLSGYTDAASVSSYAVGYVAAMAEAGIVRGTSDTNISPYANITRAATVTILHRAIDVYANVPGATVDAEGDGLVLVVADNVTVNAPAGTSVVIPSHVSSATVNGKAVAGGQAYEAAAKQPTGSSGGSSYVPSVPSVPSTPAAEDLTITESSDIEGGTYRNVTITEAVGNGEVSFTDVTITGNLTILGGGSNTIRMNGCNVHGKVKIDKDSSNNGSQPPRLHLTDTPVPQVEATKPAIIEAGDSSSTVGTLTASDDVTIQGANTKVETVSVPNVSTTPTVTVAEGAQIETVAVAPDATAAVEVNAGASVATVDAKGETIIDAVGTVETVSAAASVTVASGSVDKVEVPAGKTADITVSGSASVATVEAKGETTISATGNVAEVTAEASVTVASGSVDKMAVPEGKSANVTVSLGAAVVSVDIKGETTLNADGTVSSVTASASITISSGKVGRVEIPDDTTEAVSVTVSESASVSDVTVNTASDVTINANSASVGSVSTDKNDTGKLGKITIVGGGNESNLQPSSHNWPAEWTYVDSGSHQRICQGHPNHRHAQVDVHVWNGGTVTMAPTCEEAGVKTLTCSLCGGTKTTSIAPNGHTIVVDAYQKPTCTQPGMTEGKHCSACNTVLVEQTTIAATGHIWSSDTDPDCNSCGATREVMSEELNQLIAEAAALGLLKYLDKSTLAAGSKVSRLQISMLLGALLKVYADDATDWGFTDGKDLTDQQKAVIMVLNQNGYIGGYADGTFRPDAAVTRGSGTKVLAYALLEQQKADALIATYTVFNDVTDTVALAPYIEWAAVQGLVSGDRNGNFRPYDMLTIEDALRWFIIMARSFDPELFELIAQAKALGLLKYLDENSLIVSSKVSRLQISMLVGALLNVDISKAPAWNFSDGADLTAQQRSVIMTLCRTGTFAGYADGTFRPDTIPTRGAGAKILAYVCLGQEKADNLTATYTVFNDVDSSVALAPYIEWAANNGIVSGDRNGNFRPYDALTVKDALRLFIKIASLDGSYGVTNIRFEDQYIKWDQPTAVTEGMNAHYQVRLYDSITNSRSNCGTSDLQVANFVFPARTYDRIEVTTRINGKDMATVSANISLEITSGTATSQPTATCEPAFDEENELIGYNVNLTGLTAGKAYSVHATDNNVLWGWGRGNFRDITAKADGTATARLYGTEAIELVESGYLFVLEQVSNHVSSKTEAATSTAAVINGQPCTPASSGNTTATPTFINGYPSFMAGDNSVDIALQLNRSNTQYYCVITEVGNLPTTAKNNWSGTEADTDTSDDISITTDNWDYLPADGTTFDGITFGNVSAPSSTNIVNASYSGSKYIIRQDSYSGGVANLNISEGLEPDTQYIAYFVLQGDTPESISEVFAFRFKTEKAVRPILTVSLQNPSAFIESNCEADVRYMMVVSGLEGNTLSQEMSTIWNETAAEEYEISGTSTETAYKSMTVLEAMETTSYMEGKAYGSVFDLFATIPAQDSVSAWFNAASTNDTSIMKVGTASLTAETLTTEVNCLKDMPQGHQEYWFIAMGKSAENSACAFSAARYLYYPEIPHPMVITIGTTLDANCSVTNDAATASNAAYSGTVTVVFDSYLYLKDGDTLLQVVDKPIGSMVDNSKYVCSPALVTSSKVEVNPQVSDSAENQYCTTLMLNFTDIRSGESFTFNQNLANSKGVTGSNVLTLKMRLVPNSDGYYIPEFYVSSTDWDATA